MLPASRQLTGHTLPHPSQSLHNTWQCRLKDLKSWFMTTTTMFVHPPLDMRTFKVRMSRAGERKTRKSAALRYQGDIYSQIAFLGCQHMI